AALISIAVDVRAMQRTRGTQRSDLAVRIVLHDDWWQLRYERNGIAFITANELHVPAGTAVSLSWSGLPPPWIDGALCLPDSDERCILIAGNTEQARFIRLWPPMWRRLPIVVEDPSRFEQWLCNEAL